jgi:glutamine amidotransferase
MCRHLAYLGPKLSLHELLFGAPHSLCSQARSPRHQVSGDDNPDGWGVGWYADDDQPHQYRTTMRIWDDVVFEKRSHVVESDAVLAAARLASPGATIHESGNAPFRDGRWLFSLNGAVKDYHSGISEKLHERVSAQRLAALEGDADSEVLFALVLDQLDGGARPEDALAKVVDDVLSITKARLNLLLTDGHQIAATRVGNSLFVRQATVASEPLDDDPAWREVPDHSLVTAHAEPGHLHHNHRPL